METIKKPSVLRFNPTHMSREYGSNIYITKGDKIDRIQFRTSIIYAGRFMGKYNIFHLYKHDIYINKTKPDEHSYRLAETCGKTFFPIVAICDQEGHIIGIRNDLIRERWKQQKPNIQREFVGEYADRYINQTDQNLFKSTLILDLIHRDLFFNTFFNLKYSYRFELDRELDQKMSFFSFKHFLKTEGIQKNNLEGDKIFIYHTAKIIDPRQFSYNNLLSKFEDLGYGKIKGDYRVNYELDFNLQTIDSIMLDSVLKKENGDTLMSVKMESYYLREYPLENIVDKDTIKLGQRIQEEEIKQARKNRKPFWQRFKDYLNEPR